MIQQRKNIFSCITVLLVVSFFGLIVMSSQFDMSSSSEKMISCPYAMDSTGICPMSFNEHFLQWKSLFSAVTPNASQSVHAIVGIVLFCAFFLFLSFTFFRNRYRIASSRGDPLARTFIALLRALRLGLIHPRLYA